MWKVCKELEWRIDEITFKCHHSHRGRYAGWVEVRKTIDKERERRRLGLRISQKGDRENAFKV